MNIDDYMRPITDAARIVKASLPSHHGLELADLVQIGTERILRHLTGNEPGWLAFVCAKQGMIYEVARWRAGRQARRLAPMFVEYDDAWDSSVWRRSSALDLELLIDLKRALLSMQLREAVSWYSHHWLCQELGHLETELGVTEGRIRQYCASAREKLKAAWRGDGFETEEERATRNKLERREIEKRQALANEKMLRERRERREQLVAMGASNAQACVGCRSRLQFGALVRQLTAPAEGSNA